MINIIDRCMLINPYFRGEYGIETIFVIIIFRVYQGR